MTTITLFVLLAITAICGAALYALYVACTAVCDAFTGGLDDHS